MESQIASTFSLNPSYSLDDLKALQEELVQLNSDLSEANEQRAQAAEYGLVLLEEKQALQGQYEELSNLYESTKRELDSSTNALKQIQADYEKRLKDVEAQREQLLEEMETRESSLINEVDKGEEKVRQLERKLKQSANEHDYLNDHNTHLNKELEKCRGEVENYKDENSRLKQGRTAMSKEAEELRGDVGRLESRLEQLGRFEEECHRLRAENSSLMRDSRALQEQFESVVMEKENLEYQAQEAVQALGEEREVRGMLEIRLQEDSRLPPAHASWAAEDGEEGRQSRGRSERNSDLRDVASAGKDGDARSSKSPTPARDDLSSFKLQHSTPFPTKNPPSLLSEIQGSFLLEAADKEELDSLRRKLSEMEAAAETFRKEKRVLEDNVTASSLREAEQCRELEGLREKFAREVRERDKAAEELNQRMLIRDEQIEQLRAKMATANAERTSMEIEVDGLTNEIQRLKVVSGVELEKVQRELSQEQTRNIELRSQVGVLEERAAEQAHATHTLEDVVLSSQAELVTMTEDIRTLQKAVSTLGSADGRPSPVVGGKSAGGSVGVKSSVMQTAEGGLRSENGGGGHTSNVNGTPRGHAGLTNGDAEEEGGEEEKGGELSDAYYSLKIARRKSSVQVNNQNNSLRAIVSLREQLKMVRAPLEQFTRNMLEKSLLHSAKTGAGSHSPLLQQQQQQGPSSSSSINSSTSTGEHGANRKSTLDLEAAVSKWKSKLMHKTEELSNLRAIMKARATTAEVATSSLRSKLEGQARAYQTELTKLRYQIKILKKEKDEHLSLRTMYAKRCEDYIDEITRARKAMERRQQEYDELMVSLQKTIQRKLELSTELEEYKMDQERRVLIPRLLESSRV